MPMAEKSLGEAAKKSVECGVHWNEQKVCDTPVPVEPGWKPAGYGNQGDDLNGLPPPRRLVI